MTDISKIGFKRFLPQPLREKINTWFNGKGCFWISDDFIKNNPVFQQMKAEETMSIRLFAIASAEAMQSLNTDKVEVTINDEIKLVITKERFTK